MGYRFFLLLVAVVGVCGIWMIWFYEQTHKTVLF
jgi:hypothetical protein